MGIMKRLNNIFVQLKDITDSASTVKTYAAFTSIIQGLIDDLNKDTKKHYEVLEQKKKDRTEIREKEHAIFVKEKEQYDSAIAFMKEFIQMVADKFGGAAPAVSFIQFSEGLLRKTSKLGNVESAVPDLIMMSQYVSAAKGDFNNWSGSDASKTLTAKLVALNAVMEADLEKIVALENKRQA